MSYVDGFVLSVPTARLEEYKAMAESAGKIWMEHGATGFFENAADDMTAPNMLPFPELAKAKDGETVLFSYITYKDRAHRDEVNKKVFEDPRMKDMCNPENPPFDCARMAYGGFKSIVSMS